MFRRATIRETLTMVVTVTAAIVVSQPHGSNRCALTAGEPFRAILPEQRCLVIRDPNGLCQVPVTQTPAPATVSNPQFDAEPRLLTLDDAINLALTHSEVVRVLSGVTASSSGRTIYDTAISNTAIDEQRAAFDPNLRLNQLWNQVENPTAAFDPLDPNQAIINGVANEGYGLEFDLSKRNLLGGSTNLGVNSNTNRLTPGVFPINPSDRTATELSYTQPLLRGAGRAVNQVPIVLAQIQTERSYFQYKNAVQSSVQGVIAAYWALVFARTDQWARERQVEQANFAYQQASSRLEVGDANAGELAQTKLALENFKASLLASQANVLQRQAALLNILGLPPYEATRTTPITPPVRERLPVDWAMINDLAQRQRPDIIELKLVLEADQQRLLLADNEARPQLNGIALYRWNGLEGIVPAGNRIQSGDGQFTDWSLGVNFSVPLGLRRERALLRQQELIIRRDRANLEQGLHAVEHLLALSLRNLDQFYSQYERFREVRQAARTNLEQQLARYQQGIVQFIVVLQAIVDWGNSVSSEAQALTQYNTELANLELQTGTILQSHNVFFYQERFRSIGPFGRCGDDACYPRSQPAGRNTVRYDVGEGPSEEFFDLEDPVADAKRAAMELDQLGPIEMDQDIQFEKNERSKPGPKSDEEINKMLDEARSGNRLLDFLKLPFLRR